ncbi:MAG: hypothetical protein ACRDZO_08835 [Egibacteraceae bacterium]
MTVQESLIPPIKHAQLVLPMGLSYLSLFRQSSIPIRIPRGRTLNSFSDGQPCGNADWRMLGQDRISLFSQLERLGSNTTLVRC